MVKDDKGNPTPIQSLGKFEEPDEWCSQRKFCWPNTRFGASLFGHPLLDSNFKWNHKKIVLIESR